MGLIRDGKLPGIVDYKQKMGEVRKEVQCADYGSESKGP